MPDPSWTSLQWEGRKPLGVEGFAFKEQQPISNAVLLSLVRSSGLTSIWERTKCHVLLSVKLIIGTLLKPAEIPTVSSLEPDSIPLKTLWTWGFVGMVENFPVKHPDERLVEKPENWKAQGKGWVGTIQGCYNRAQKGKGLCYLLQPLSVCWRLREVMLPMTAMSDHRTLRRGWLTGGALWVTSRAIKKQVYEFWLRYSHF